MIPAKLSSVMNVKNLRYTLNHSTNRIHRLTFGEAAGLGFLTVALSLVASVAFDPSGNGSDSSGTLAAGVMPWCTGDSGHSSLVLPKLYDDFSQLR